jgi:hypothetical protein
MTVACLGMRQIPPKFQTDVADSGSELRVDKDVSGAVRTLRKHLEF